MPESDHYILISADAHAGADIRGYQPYLESKYHDDFEVWAASMEEGSRMMREMMKNLGMKKSVGVDGDPETDADRNWNSERRLREQEADGWVAEVIFPNTQPPFAPMARSQLEAPPLVDDVEHRWAGLRAHNRWLADYVSLAPERRAGCAQIYLGDVEGSVAEIEWAAEHNLRGGIVLPGAPPGSGFLPLYAAEYEPIWAACEANEMPVNHHSGGGTPDFGMHPPASDRHVHARGHLVGAPPAVAPHLLGRVRAASRTCTSATPRAARSGSSTRCPSSTASTTA